MRNEAAFVRPFQVVLDLALAATHKLAVLQTPLYPREPIPVLLDEVHIDQAVEIHGTLVNFSDIPPQVVNVQAWRLHTEGFYLNEYGKAVARWPNDLCGVLSVSSYDIVRDFYEPHELHALADEIMDIIVQ